MDAFTVIKKVTSTFLENLQIPHKHLPKYSRQSLAEVKLSSNLSVFGAFIYASKVNGVFFFGGGGRETLTDKFSFPYFVKIIFSSKSHEMFLSVASINGP